MIDLSLTTKEAISLEHLISTAQALTNPNTSISGHDRLAAVRKLLTPEVLSALGKFHTELDNLAQAQQLLLQQTERHTDLTSGEIIALCRRTGTSVSEFMGVPKLSREEAIGLKTRSFPQRRYFDDQL